MFHVIESTLEYRVSSFKAMVAYVISCIHSNSYRWYLGKVSEIFLAA